MYAGILSTKHAASWLGAHQKLDRLAYRGLKKYVLVHSEPLEARSKLTKFPPVKLIQHFEGVNGPDGIKMKSPGKAEPSYAYNPYDSTNSSVLTELIDQHEIDLKKALKEGNEERAAFEASWLAHTIVDGLTPAHHYPYEQELEELRGEGMETRTSKTKKVLIKGANTRETIKKNWKMIGAKGLLSTHVNFEAGVASSLIPLRLRSAIPSAVEVEYARQNGLVNVFEVTARAIADLDLYERFYKQGWTVNIARDVRSLMLPQMVKTISLAWLLALEDK